MNAPFISTKFWKCCVLMAASALLAVAPGCASNAQHATGAHLNNTMTAEKPTDDPFEQATNRPPTPKTLYSLAQMFEAQGKDAQAVPVLQRILAQEPRYMPAYCDLAEIQMRARRIDDAYQTLSEGLKYGPQELVLLNDRGMCQLLLHDYEGALADFIRATAIRPDDARGRSNMAVALAMLGRYDESFALYTLVMPASDAYYNLAVLCDARGDAKRAAEYRVGKHSSADAKPAMPTAPSAEAGNVAVTPATIALGPAASAPIAAGKAAVTPVGVATVHVTIEPPPAVAPQAKPATVTAIDPIDADSDVEIEPPLASSVAHAPSIVAGTPADESDASPVLPGEDNGSPI